jgi:hypothetical protein
MKTLSTEKVRVFSGTEVFIGPVIVGSKKIDIIRILEATLKSQPMAKSLKKFPAYGLCSASSTRTPKSSPRSFTN